MVMRSMKHSFVIIDDNQQSISEIVAITARFPDLLLMGTASDYDSALDLILEQLPSLIFIEIDRQQSDSRLSLALISELHRYLAVIPKIIVVTDNAALALEAVKYNVFDFVLKPVMINSMRKSLLRLQKETASSTGAVELMTLSAPVVETPIIVLPETENNVQDEQISPPVTEPQLPADLVADKGTVGKPLVICVKSYGDYRFIDAKDICYLQADNNSTDIHLSNGEMITAFKTLKHFEGVLATPFVRIHNSYIVNIDYVSRIHTGNAVCYIKNTTTKLPFSKSYKENVDAILNRISTGNYLEI